MKNREWMNQMTAYDLLQMMNSNLFDVRVSTDAFCILDVIGSFTDCHNNCTECLQKWLEKEKVDVK